MYSFKKVFEYEAVGSASSLILLSHSVKMQLELKVHLLTKFLVPFLLLYYIFFCITANRNAYAHSPQVTPKVQ